MDLFTLEEQVHAIANLIANRASSLTASELEDSIIAAIYALVETEREACAELAAVMESCNGMPQKLIAAAIRQRNKRSAVAVYRSHQPASGSQVTPMV